jgi:N-acetylneuraminic acid mutarotase
MKNFIVIFLLSPLLLFAQTWQTVQMDSITSHKRHEGAGAIVNGKYYLIGGRGIKPVDCFNVQTNKCDSVASLPLEMHHLQTVVFKKNIYIVGAFTGNYPHETPIGNVYIFNTKTNAWTKGAEIPVNRRRGAAGAVLYKNKIFIIAGITDGHWDGHVAWLDEYNPVTNEWKQLPDAPHARDHFQAVVAQNKLYVIAGRKSSAKTKEVFQLTEKSIDVYDFVKRTWQTLDCNCNIPTARAGCTAVLYKNKIIVIGGESGTQLNAHNEVEAFDVVQQKWALLSTLNKGRHGTQAGLYKNKIYIADGCGKRGGEPELNSVEVLDLNEAF